MDRFFLGVLTGLAALIAPLLVASLSLPLPETGGAPAAAQSSADAAAQDPDLQRQTAAVGNDANRDGQDGSKPATPAQAPQGETDATSPDLQPSGPGPDMAERVFSRQGFKMALPTDWPDTTEADKARLTDGSGIFSAGSAGLLLSSMTVLKPDGNIDAQFIVLFGRPRFDDPLAVADRRQKAELERYQTAKVIRLPSRIEVNGLRGAQATTRITSQGAIGRVTNTIRLTVLYVGRNALMISSVAKTGSKAESQINMAIASVQEVR